ncbi:MAG: hypothetical protein JO257_26915 [Deltaproteobacteria bacterium]|nr:hypothetical protein [Deltaproteobacteria bacterium]
MKRALLIFVAACKPDLGAPQSLVTQPRVLAVQSEPAEVAPGHDTQLHALIASTDGTLTPDVAWGFCTDPAPLSSNNVVGDDCIYTAASLMARGTTITATMPIDACSQFGPTPPAPEPGQPPRRPHDADVTGGFYQPIRALAKLGPDEQVPAIGLTRITCDLANASFDVVQQYKARYHANTNPTIERTLAQLPGTADAADMPRSLPAHTAIPLRVRWSEDSAETFPVFDPKTRALVDHREAIRVSWFVDDGGLASERTGRTENETDAFADNTWTTGDAGAAHLWIVVRDTRGGTALESFDVTITP